MLKRSKAELQQLVEIYTRKEVDRKEKANSYTKTYRAKMVENGFVSVNVWVPKDKKKEIQELAAKMRAEAGAEK